MLRTIVSCTLVYLLVMGAGSASAADLAVPQQVAKLKAGRKIKVELITGETLKGRMGSSTPDQFSLEPGNKAQGTARVILFTEARSVKADGLTTGQKWAIFGAVWVGIAIVAKLAV